MPLISSQNAEKRCCWCFKMKDVVKACGRCRMVRYCSVECQKAAWKTHKQSCSSANREAIKRDPTLAASATALSQWIAFWRDSIFNWACWILDIPHKPRDRLQTHVFVLNLVEREGVNPPHMHYKMAAAALLTRETMVQRMRVFGRGISEQYLETYKNDRRAEDTVQIAVLDERQIRILWFRYRRMDEMRAIMPDGIPDLLIQLQEDWEEVMRMIFDLGEAERTRQYFVDRLCCVVDHLVTGDDAEERKARVLKFYTQRSTLTRFGIDRALFGEAE